MDPAEHEPVTTRDGALARVLQHRERGRRRSPAVRLGMAGLGAVLLLASLPLVIVLPELGIPALLAALRLLAVEADWAAKAYAWIDWRFTQALEWYRRQSNSVRTLVVVGLLAIAVVVVWFLIHEFL